MDNDNPLLQKAADLYRGLRFTMKYRGVDILPAAAGNDLARDLLESGQPFLFGRCGATEMRTVADWLQNGGHNFTDRTRADIRSSLRQDCAERRAARPLERRGRAGGHPRL